MRRKAAIKICIFCEMKKLSSVSWEVWIFEICFAFHTKNRELCTFCTILCYDPCVVVFINSNIRLWEFCRSPPCLLCFRSRWCRLSWLLLPLPTLSELLLPLLYGFRVNLASIHHRRSLLLSKSSLSWRQFGPKLILQSPNTRGYSPTRHGKGQRQKMEQFLIAAAAAEARAPLPGLAKRLFVLSGRKDATKLKQ